MIQPEAIRNFFEANKAPFGLIGLLQVGSTARGYSLDSSDVDLMAFYNAGPGFVSFPVHKKEGNVAWTLEHHDINRFMVDTADYRFNLGSIRQLHKVRDAIVVIENDGLLNLLNRAKESHLDATVLLHALANIATAIHDAQNESQEIRRLLQWAELLSTLELVSMPGRAAYSKPKWLHRALRDAQLQDAVLLLDQLDYPSATRIQAVSSSVKAIIEKDPAGHCTDDFKLLIKTAANDAQSMIRLCPHESLPAVRFFASQVLRGVHSVAVQEAHLDPTMISDPDIYNILSPNLSVELGAVRSSFYAFSKRIAINLTNQYEQAAATAIGTRRFYTHYLATFGATDLLPHISLVVLRSWVEQVKREFLEEN